MRNITNTSMYLESGCRSPSLIVPGHADAALALARAALLAPDALVVGGAGALQVGELRAAAARARALVEELVVVAVEHVALAPARALVLLHLLHRREQCAHELNRIDFAEIGLRTIKFFNGIFFHNWARYCEKHFII